MIRRQANVAIVRSLIDNVLIYNQEDNSDQIFFDYKADFDELEDLCMRQMIEEDSSL